MLRTIDVYYKNPEKEMLRVTEVIAYKRQKGKLIIETIWGYEIEIPLKEIKRWQML